MTSETLKIDGMDCAHCVNAVKRALSKLDLNIKDVQVGSADIEYDETLISRNIIVDAILDAGYTVK
ncbi:MAG: cation transporter [Chloroherpetonaceae bacterium]|nr:cation transporter [bacterium]